MQSDYAPDQGGFNYQSIDEETRCLTSPPFSNQPSNATNTIRLPGTFLCADAMQDTMQVQQHGPVPSCVVHTNGALENLQGPNNQRMHVATHVTAVLRPLEDASINGRCGRQ